MKLVDQWNALEQRLPEDWHEIRLRVRTENAADLDEAARVLGPMTVGRTGDALVFAVGRAGGASGPQAARRLFGYLDDARVWATLEETEVSAGAGATDEQPTPVAPTADATLATGWDRALATLPSDWSDVLGELEIDSSDNLDRVALLCAPINPARDGDRLAFTFRCARTTGYGVSPGMARRCFERCDAEGLLGRVGILRVLSDTDPVGTQGPVWIVAGKML